MSLKKLPTQVLNQIMQGNDLVLKTWIQHDILVKYPGEVKLLQNMYQRAFIKFREMIPELRIGESNYEN